MRWSIVLVICRIAGSSSTRRTVSSPAFGYLQRLVPKFFVGLTRMPGKIYLEGRPLARLAVHVDEAVVLLDDAVDRRQTKACAFAHRLGGEKGSKSLSFVFSSIPQPLSLTASSTYSPARALPIGAAGFVEGDGPSFYGDLAVACDGVSGVHAQIGEDLVDLGGVHLHRPQLLPGSQTSSMSSPISLCSILSIPSTVSFRSSTLGATVCLRAKARSCRVRSAERSAAFRIS